MHLNRISLRLSIGLWILQLLSLPFYFLLWQLKFWYFEQFIEKWSKFCKNDAPRVLLSLWINKSNRQMNFLVCNRSKSRTAFSVDPLHLVSGLSEWKILCIHFHLQALREEIMKRHRSTICSRRLNVSCAHYDKNMYHVSYTDTKLQLKHSNA